MAHPTSAHERHPDPDPREGSSTNPRGRFDSFMRMVDKLEALKDRHRALASINQLLGLVEPLHIEDLRSVRADLQLLATVYDAELDRRAQSSIDVG